MLEKMTEQQEHRTIYVGLAINKVKCKLVAYTSASSKEECQKGLHERLQPDESGAVFDLGNKFFKEAFYMWLEKHDVPPNDIKRLFREFVEATVKIIEGKDEEPEEKK